MMSMFARQFSRRFFAPFCFAVAAVVGLLSAGCSSSSPVRDIIEGRKVDYEKEEYQSGRELQYPPDIIADAESEAAGSQLLSEYRIGEVPELSAPEEVTLRAAGKVAYRRQGNLHWIDIDLPPARAWQVAADFWDTLGFELEKEEPKVGTMETAWLDLRQAPGSLGFSELLDTFLKRVHDSGERDKFVTRVESRGESGSSIFVAHRHVAARFGREGNFSNFEARPPDSQLETEMLRRLMIHVARIPEAEQPEAFAEEIAAADEAASDDYDLQAATLIIAKPPKESWLLVRIGLDRGGFTIEDQDYTERAYYIRHTGGPESQQIFGKAESNFFNKLFGEEKPILRDIKMTLSDGENGGTAVTVEAADDEGDLTEAQVSVLLELLAVNLP